MTRWMVAALDKGTRNGSAVCVGTAPARLALDERQRPGPLAAVVSASLESRADDGP